MRPGDECLRNGPTVNAMTVVGEVRRGGGGGGGGRQAYLGHQSRHTAEGSPECPRDNTDNRLTSNPPQAHHRGMEGGLGGTSEPRTPDKIFNSNLKGYFTITPGPPCLFFFSRSLSLSSSPPQHSIYFLQTHASPGIVVDSLSHYNRWLIKFPWQLAASTCVLFQPVGTPQGKALSRNTRK